MGWVNWSRKPASDTPEPIHLLGLDVNAGRARAAGGRSARSRLVPLEDPGPDLPLALSLERRNPEAGRAGVGLCRRLPHLACLNYLPLLGLPHEWAGGRHRLDAASALGVFMDRLRGTCSSYEGLAFTLPAYLGLAQVSKFVQVVQKSRLKFLGSACSALAVAADRAVELLNNESPAPAAPGGWVVPMHRPGSSSASATVLVIDVDDHALSGAVLRVDGEQARLLTHAFWPRVGLKAWKDRILDVLSDRCIRLCRRDPRDSAEAEQSLYEQIDDALDRLRHCRAVTLTIRSAHWYQDLVHQAEDFDGFCAPLLRLAVEGVRDLASAPVLAEPPRAVWLTHDAARLPGLLPAVHQHMAERTAVSVLPPEALASAAANLAERWKAGDLPRVHLDTTLALPRWAVDLRVPAPKQGGVRK